MTPKKAKPAAGARAEAPRARKGAKVPPGRKVSSAREQRVTRAKPNKETGRQGDKGKRRTKSTKTAREKPWDASLSLPDEQQEFFAQLMAQGVYSRTSCYAQSHPNVTRDTARAEASTYLAKPCIRARIDWIKEEALKKVKASIEESVLWYQRVCDTPVGYVDEESPLAQEVNYDPETGAVTKIKIPSKMDARKQIDKLMGFDRDKDDPMAKAVDAMAEMVRMIREGKKP